MLRWFCFLFFLSFAFHSYAIGEQYGKLYVLVSDYEGNLIPGAKVELSSPALTSGARIRFTDEKGNTIFEELPPGKYKAIMSADGFQKVTLQNIHVSAGKTTSVFPVLRLMPANEEQPEDKYETMLDGFRCYSVLPDCTKSSLITGTSLNTYGFLEEDSIIAVPNKGTFQDLATMFPGVISNNTGNPHITGGTFRSNLYDMTNPLTGTFSPNIELGDLSEVYVIMIPATGYHSDSSAVNTTRNLFQRKLLYQLRTLGESTSEQFATNYSGVLRDSLRLSVGVKKNQSTKPIITSPTFGAIPSLSDSLLYLSGRWSFSTNNLLGFYANASQSSNRHVTQHPITGERTSSLQDQRSVFANVLLGYAREPIFGAHWIEFQVDHISEQAQ